ncbi:hypothetical protein ACFQYP_45105 [Nonomuraea antimicrobica]
MCAWRTESCPPGRPWPTSWPGGLDTRLCRPGLGEAVAAEPISRRPLPVTLGPIDRLHTDEPVHPWDA